MKNVDELLTRRVNDILPSIKSFKNLLNKRQITLYQGFDPSRPDLHIGHLVGLLQLKMFQDAGHKVIFLIGDFTGMIGDPTEKSATRPKLTREEVVENAKTYRDQAGKILNFVGDNPAEIKFNSHWLDKLDFADVLELSSNVTVQQLMERDMFQNRIKDQKPIYLHEFMYPLLQGYDSVAMEVDLEIGGNDQLFNMMMGRSLMKSLKGKEKYVLTTKLITDANGNKIGKTTGNAVNLFGDPNDTYGQVMSFPDESVILAFELATEVALDEIRQLEKALSKNPMQVKKRLAHEIVTMCHSKMKADIAAAHFQATVQNREVVESDVVKSTVSANGADELTILDFMKSQEVTASSNSDIKRMIKEGGVEVNKEKISDMAFVVKTGDVIKFGKRTFIEVVLN